MLDDGKNIIFGYTQTIRDINWIISSLSSHIWICISIMNGQSLQTRHYVKLRYHTLLNPKLFRSVSLSTHEFDQDILKSNYIIYIYIIYIYCGAFKTQSIFSQIFTKQPMARLLGRGIEYSIDPASYRYSALVPVVIYVISYNFGPSFNGTRSY